jgi:hypothetical protein
VKEHPWSCRRQISLIRRCTSIKVRGIISHIGESNPSGTRFFVPSRLTPRPTYLPVQWLPDLLGEYNGRSMVLITHLFVAPSCEGVGDSPPPTLYTCIGMSWIDLYLTNAMTRGTSWEANSSSSSQEYPRISYNPKLHYREYNVVGNKIITQNTAVIVCMSHQTDLVGWALSRLACVHHVSCAVLAENFLACPLPL